MTNIGVGSWLARRARISPDSPAFIQGEFQVSYAEAADRVSRLAGAFRTLGVRPGDRVAYLGPNDHATFETFFAAGLLGAIFVPLNTRLSGQEINYMLTDCTPTVLVVAATCAGVAIEADPRKAGVTHVFGVEDQVPGTDRCLADVLDGGSGLVDTAEVALADDALILYTSGTTGRPKGAVLTHENLTFNMVNQLGHVDVLATDVALCTAPLFHVTGLGQVSLPTLFKGGALVMAPKFDPESILTTIAQQRISAFSAVPTMLQMLSDHPSFDAADLSSLRYVIYGGSPIQERVARRWFERGVDMRQGFGMTEAAPGVLMAPPGAIDRPTSAGVPHMFVDTALEADTGGIEFGAGTGELLVRGPNVFRGYWQQTDATRNSFNDGWYRSGDVVRVDEHGWGDIVDRVKDMIISGGENIYPAEVEAVINAIPGVQQCALIGVPDEKWGEVGVALVVPIDGATLSEARILGALDGQLARYKVPKFVRVVNALPQTATGKVLKSQLRQKADLLSERNAS